MQLALRGKQLLIKRVAVLLMVLVVFCAPLIKPPVKVEAAVIPVVAGAAIVAAAMSALGIGVAAGFDTAALAEGAQKVWDDLSESVRNTIVLTQVAGHTVAHFTEQALRDIFSGLQTAFPQNATDSPVYSHPGSFSSRDDLISFFSQLGISASASLIFTPNPALISIGTNHTLSYSDVSNFRVVGFYNLPVSSASYTGTNYFDISLPDGTSFQFTRSVDNSSFKIKNYLNSARAIDLKGSAYHAYRASENGNWHADMDIPVNTPLIGLLFDVGSRTYTILLSLTVSDDLGAVYTYFSRTALVDGISAIPAPGQDVFNPASDKFYADGASVMSNPVDDVINRLKDGVGETGQISDQPDVITVPGQIVGDSVTDQTKGADQAGTIGKDISTEADKAANDATNADRDTTKPSTPGEDTDIPDLSIPQIITNKFPFSIPWDLYNSVRILVAPAAAPKWVLPLRFDKLGVNTSITIDMAQFDGLAALSRWGLSLLFIISLIILSSKLVKR